MKTIDWGAVSFASIFITLIITLGVTCQSGMGACAKSCGPGRVKSWTDSNGLQHQPEKCECIDGPAR